MLQVFQEIPYYLTNTNTVISYELRYMPIVNTIVVLFNYSALFPDNISLSNYSLLIKSEELPNSITVSYLTNDNVPRTDLEIEPTGTVAEVISNNEIIDPTPNDLSGDIIQTSSFNPRNADIGNHKLFYLNLENYDKLTINNEVRTSQLYKDYGHNRFSLHKPFQYANNKIYDIFNSRFIKELKLLKAGGSMSITSQAYNPPLLSYDIYGVTDLWNILLWYNNCLSSQDLTIGKVIKYPTLGNLETLYFKLQSKQQKYNRN